MNEMGLNSFSLFLKIYKGPSTPLGSEKKVELIRREGLPTTT